MGKSIGYVTVAIAACLVGGLSMWIVAQGKEKEEARGPADVAGKTRATREFQIEGMSCPACVEHLTAALNGIPGVTSAEVSLQQKKAVLVASESQVPTEKVLGAIRKAGYEGRLVSPREIAASATVNPVHATGGFITMKPIGVVHSPYKEIEGTPIQGVFDQKSDAWVELNPEYAPGLKDLDGFSHAILLYQFHLSDKVDLVGKPYLENEEHGIFAMRSPHRPNHLGMSVVAIKKIEGNRLDFKEVVTL